MKSLSWILTIVLLSLLIQSGKFFIIESAVIGAVGLISYTFQCKFFECCDDYYINRNTPELKRKFTHELYGQHIARDIIYSAVQSHVHHNNPKKPLVLSFHGVPGSGKNYAASMVAQTLFKNKDKSYFYYFFNGRHDFPMDTEVNIYKLALKEKIERALQKCERSLFVFDEVDKMPPGVLDTLVPFLDYTNWNYMKKSKSIFIFLSNTGSNLIVQRMIELWENGKSRDDTTLQDFENLISIGAFNEKGGLHKSGTIESKVIDHFVPFLPMEEKHVIECIKDLFNHWNSRDYTEEITKKMYIEPTKENIDKVLSHVTFGPPPHNLYSTAGCKRLDHKVSILLADEFDD